MILLIGLAFVTCQSTSSARQDNSNNSQSAGTQAASTERPVSDNSVPQPTETLQALFDKAQVQFVTGGSPQSDDPTFPYQSKLAGETRFTFRYQYDSHVRWIQLRHSGHSESDEPKVRIRVRFRKLKFIVSHEVWLRDLPTSERFWNDPIVLHELDHVRISSDPRVERQFIDGAQAITTFEVPRSSVSDAGGVIKEAAIRGAVDQQLQTVLRTVTDYVQIRYRELDRLTQHGLRSLPPDSQLFAEPGGTHGR